MQALTLPVLATIDTIYRMVKNLAVKILADWSQNMLGKDIIGRLSTYTEGNQGKAKEFDNKTLID